jgi:hypothetical protein
MEHVNYPTWSGIIYGNPGLGKTYFASSFPKPMKIFMFDPPAKGLAYQQQGNQGSMISMPSGGKLQYITQPETGELAVEIEYFSDAKPTIIGMEKEPCAYERFQASLYAHMDEGWMTAEEVPHKFQTVVLDSYTFCELACVRMQQFKVNPAPGGIQDAKHNQMQWSGAARNVLLTDIVSTWPYIPCHNMVLAHVNDKRFDEQEKQLYGISAIGTLGVVLPSAFAEVYLIFVQYNDKEKKYENWLMTERNGQYIAQSHIGAPNPCRPAWEALWE